MYSTEVQFLPGYLVATFRHPAGGTVHCYWKGGPDCAWLFFYLEDPDNPEILEGEYKDLANLEFDYVVKDHEKAKALAEEVWERHDEQIRAENGVRLYVEGDELVDARGRWLEDNKGGIDDYNEHIKKDGILAPAKEGFDFTPGLLHQAHD